MTGLLREVGRARRAMEQFAEAEDRIGAFSVRLEELPLLHAGDSFALLTGNPAVEETIARQMAGMDSSLRAAEQEPLPNSRGSDGIAGTTGLRMRAATSWQAKAPALPVGQTLSSVNPAIGGEHGFSNSATVLAQRFEQAGLKTAWETAFHTAVQPPPAAPVTPTAGPASAIAAVPSQQLLRIVERAERAGRARTPAQRRPGLTGRQIPMAVGDREFVPPRPLTPAEAENLRATATGAPASGVTSRQWPIPAGVADGREWAAASASDGDAGPRQPWVPPTGSGLRRLASLAGVPPGGPARQDPVPALPSAAFPDYEWPLRHSAPASGGADFVTQLEEALHAEALRNGIDPEELIR